MTIKTTIKYALDEDEKEALHKARIALGFMYGQLKDNHSETEMYDAVITALSGIDEINHLTASE